MPLARRIELLAVAGAKQTTHDFTYNWRSKGEPAAAFVSFPARRNLLIIEDDACYHLTHTGVPRVRSLLSLDTEGRVIRCDSFSKVRALSRCCEGGSLLLFGGI
jgi:hypothetical protein